MSFSLISVIAIAELTTVIKQAVDSFPFVIIIITLLYFIIVQFKYQYLATLMILTRRYLRIIVWYYFIV